MLCELEADAGGGSCDPDSDPTTVEHILPENPSGAWEEGFPQKSWDASVCRIGNLTLMEASQNRRVGNSEYLEKVAAYRASACALSKAVAEDAPERWTPELLDARQRRLARRAVHLWRADFA